jgi:TRAP-type C4-dicarboxylate transport system permease small subunit
MTMYDPASQQATGLLQSLTGWLLIIAGFLALSGATLIITLDVVLRYGFNAPLLWSMELNQLLLPLLVFGCMPYVWERGAHIHMELVIRLFPKKGRALCDLVIAFCGGLFGALLAVGMAKNAIDMFRYHQGAEYLPLPFWPFATFVSLIGMVMTLQFVIHAVGAFVRLIAHD